jgi:general secretion pathway protein L
MPVRETLFLRLRDLVSQGMVATVTVAGESAAAMVHKVPASQLPMLAASHRAVIFVPAAEVRLSKVAPPVRQTSKALQATPYLLEEQLAEDVESLHFALGPRQDDGSFPVAVVATARLAEWLQQIKSHGIEPQALVPEMLALPPPAADTWSALADREQIIVRNAPWSGFVADEQSLDVMLQVADGTGEPHALQLFVMRDDARDFTRLQRRVELRPGHAHALEVYARHYRSENSINLLQGSHARHESWSRYWQPWKLAAGLAAACFVGGVALNGVTAWKLRTSSASRSCSRPNDHPPTWPRRSRAWCAARAAAAPTACSSCYRISHRPSRQRRA